MNAHLYDMRRTLTGGMAIAIVLLALLGGALAYGSVASVPVPPTLNGAGFYTYENGSYHVDLYAFGIAGAPARSVAMTLTLISPGPNATPGPLGPERSFSAVTDGDGRAVFDLPAPNVTFYARLVVSGLGPPSSDGAPGGPQGALAGFELNPPALGAVDLLDPFTLVAANLYVTNGALVVVDAGPGGAAPRGSTVQECTYLTRLLSSAPPDCSGYSPKIIASLTGSFTEVAPFVGPAGMGVVVELVDPNGTVAATYSYVGAAGGPGSTPGPPQPELFLSPPGVSMLSDFSSTAPLVLLLAGFFVSYVAYARPRLAGYLDPLLVRPVTRPGLLLARFAATAVLLAALSLAIVTAFDLSASSVLGVGVPLGDLLVLTATLFVAGAAVAGFVVLTAHLSRAPTAPLAVGLGLVLLLGPFWLFLVDLFGTLSYRSAGPYAYEALVDRLLALSPDWLLASVVNLLTGIGTQGGSGSIYTYAGLGAGVFAAIALAWAVPPIVLAVLWARWHD